MTLPTDPYKGVRDFYPEDMAIQKHIFAVWRNVAERYGYEEYNASILESADLYRSKGNDEIVNEQTYTFTDRGDREVTLRPEMTPTVARMIAARKRELLFPVRWYSIPNVFRYERPQRGRLREHWQLNADIFGSDAPTADVEIIALARDVLKGFGATDADFLIRINNRAIWSSIVESLNISPDKTRALAGLVDRKTKMSVADYDAELETLLSDKKPNFDAHMERLSRGDFSAFGDEHKGVREIQAVLEALTSLGAPVVYDPALMRGFDYYTGTVFEIFDSTPENPRSLCGGGRYDKLLELFGGDTMPAVGFGMGDVTVRDFLETHNLLPTPLSKTQLMICVINDSARASAHELATSLRTREINVAVYEGNKKVGDQIAIAAKKHIPFVFCVGEKELSSGTYALKDLRTGEEHELDIEGVAGLLSAPKN